MTDNQTYLTFPCDFPIKIIGKKNERFLIEIAKIVREHFPETSDASIQIRPSKQDRYLAITVTVEAHDKPSLDALYQALTKHPDIKMVL